MSDPEDMPEVTRRWRVGYNIAKDRVLLVIDRPGKEPFRVELSPEDAEKIGEALLATQKLVRNRDSLN